MDQGSLQDNVTECYKWIIQSFYINKLKIILHADVLNHLGQAIKQCQKQQQKLLSRNSSTSFFSRLKAFRIKQALLSIYQVFFPRPKDQSPTNK